MNPRAVESLTPFTTHFRFPQTGLDLIPSCSTYACTEFQREGAPATLPQCLQRAFFPCGLWEQKGDRLPVVPGHAQTLEFTGHPRLHLCDWILSSRGRY